MGSRGPGLAPILMRSPGTLVALHSLVEMLADDGFMVPCRVVGVDVFFDETVSAQRAAKEACTGCPVMRVCDAHAVAADERGVWGGRTRRERQEDPSGGDTGSHG